MNQMIDSGFSVRAINDTLLSANLALQRADFADLIRKNATGDLADRVRNALAGLNYEGFQYSDVLQYTNNISLRKQEAYSIADSIKVLEVKIGNYRNQSVNTSDEEVLLNDAKIAFQYERYQEASDLLSKANSDLDAKKAELTSLNVIVTSGKTFISKHWQGLLIFAVILIVLGGITWRRLRIRNLKNKIKTKTINFKK